MTTSTPSGWVLRLARSRRAIRRKELAAKGVHSQVLSRLVKSGALERVARGRYRLPDAPTSEHHGLALAAAAVPRGRRLPRLGAQLPWHRQAATP
jgi:hypothetical protein